MTDKLKLTVLCGGQSTEHEISIISATNVVSALNKNRYSVNVIYITREGEWYLIMDIDAFLQKGPEHLYKAGMVKEILIPLGRRHQAWIEFENPQKKHPVDCVFPVLHGMLGEDGALQGLLEMMNVPYVGAGVQGSVICMEKHLTKQILNSAGLPTAKWLLVDNDSEKKLIYQQMAEYLGEVFFIKPVSLGSSIGICKVKNERDYERAIQDAFQYDDQVIAEAYIPGREIECSVLGNDKPVASLPGEVVTRHDFYSYEAKYLDPEGAELITPAVLSETVIKKIQSLAVKAFDVCQCKGMVRVDFFVEGEEVTINELNTLPGFTNISLYPKNWEASGLDYSRLLDNLVDLALQRFRKQQNFSKTRIIAANTRTSHPQQFEGME